MVKVTWGLLLLGISSVSSTRRASAIRVARVQYQYSTYLITFILHLPFLLVPSSSSPPPAEEELETAAAYAHSILKTLANVLSAKLDEGHTDVVKYIDRLVPRLYNLFIYSALVGEERPMAATDPRLLSVAAHIVTLVSQSLSAS